MGRLKIQALVHNLVETCIYRKMVQCGCYASK